MNALPVHPRLRGGPPTWDAHLALLDRQVRDVRGAHVTCVADLELSDWEPGRPAPVITNLIVGSGIWQRILEMHPPSSPVPRIPWSKVADVATTVTLTVDGADLDVTWVHRWLSDRVISRIWGGT